MQDAATPAPVDKKALQRTARSCEEAYQACASTKTLIDELNEYVMPYRATAGSKAATTADRVDRIFDGTAPKAAFRFAGRMSQDVTPAFQSFYALKVGPYLKLNPDAKKTVDEQLEIISKKISAVLENAQFSTAASEMYLDLFGGTGAMLMLEHERDIMRFVAVPVTEIALREDLEPEDVARAALYLASDLSGYVSGDSLRVDGGMMRI